MTEQDLPMVKVILETEEETETLWAKMLPSGHVRLDNAPFFFYGASADDILEVLPEPHTDVLYRFVRVVVSSGNYTIRIFSEDVAISSPEFKPILDRLLALQCGYEGFPPCLLAVTIPAEHDVDLVLEFLNEQELMWEYGNPTYEVLFGAEVEG